MPLLHSRALQHTQTVLHVKGITLARPLRLAALHLALALGLSSIAPAHAASTTPPAARAPAHDAKGAVRELERLAARVVNDAGVVGLGIAVVHQGRVVSEQGFGVTRAGSRDAVGPDTVFRLASLSKAFAGTVAAQLVDEGALRWESRVSDQLPAFALKHLPSAENLTLKDILSHRVGLPRNALDPDLEQNEPFPLLVSKLAETPMICEAGECYAYQNIAFSLVGDLVFAATGDFYTHQVEKRLFHPLGMYSATFGRDALEASESWAQPHVRGRRGWVPVRPKETYYRVPPAAGVNASVRDLSQWLLAQLGHHPEVLSPDLLASIQSPQVDTPGERTVSPWRRDRVRSAHYGLGWRVFDYEGTTMVYHAGAVQGYRGMIALLPEHDFGFAVLWNCESAVPSGLLPTVMDRFLRLPRTDWMGLDRFKPRRR